MLSTVLAEHRWLTTAALAVLVVTGPLAARWLVDRRRTVAWLTVLATAPVLVLTLLPDDRTAFERCTVEWSLPTLGRVELIANVVLFVLPALLGTVATRRPLLVAAAGSLASAAIEAVQAAVVAIGRSCSTNDWWTNSLGVGLGVGLAGLGLWWAGGSERRVDPTPPRR